MVTYTIFDTETTGLIPKNSGCPWSEPEGYPRVFQFAYIRVDDEGNILEKVSEFIKPDGWEIPSGEGAEFWESHGYTTEKCMKEGVDLKELLHKFISSISNSTYLVAHNLKFDRGVILSEISRYGIEVPKDFKSPELLCTMLSSINYVKAPHSKENQEKWEFLRNTYKYPKLEELYMKLFGEELVGAHDAYVDLLATYRCLKELQKLKLINPINKDELE